MRDLVLGYRSANQPATGESKKMGMASAKPNIEYDVTFKLNAWSVCIRMQKLVWYDVSQDKPWPAILITGGTVVGWGWGWGWGWDGDGDGDGDYGDDVWRWRWMGMGWGRWRLARGCQG